MAAVDALYAALPVGAPLVAFAVPVKPLAELPRWPTDAEYPDALDRLLEYLFFESSESSESSSSCES